MTAVDWNALQSMANKVMASAYPPYSYFPFDAAGLVDDGQVPLRSRYTPGDDCGYPLADG